jgi:lipooligosaccharide transport system permease protein
VIAVLPPGTLRVFEHRFLEYTRIWKGTVFNSFLTPVLFLASMGIGLGGYVDSAGSNVLGGVRYIEFLGPGLLAATAMQTGTFEATFPVLGGFIWHQIFHAMHATPISPRGIAVGGILWIGFRLLLVCSVFTGVLVLFGAVRSPLIVLAVPVAILTGLAFATFVAAFTATQRQMTKFNYIFRFGIQPLFLFSGTFFPIEQLPAFLQPVAWLTPVFHGVALARGLALGTAFENPGIFVVHAVILVGFVVVGMWLAMRNFERRLVA